jgi:hypothetical protein
MLYLRGFRPPEIRDRVEVVTGTAQTAVEVLLSSRVDKQAEEFERGEAGVPLMGSP